MSRTSERTTTSHGVRHEARAGAFAVTPTMAESHAPTSRAVDAPPASGVVLSDTTSLDDLFTAILGGDAREHDDRGALLDAVDAQVSRLRKELGLLEPPAPPPASALPTAPGSPSPDELLHAPKELDGGPHLAPRPAAWSRRRFEALLQGMPDIRGRMPRSFLIGLPAFALVAAGAIWIGASESRPREVSAAAPAPLEAVASARVPASSETPSSESLAARPIAAAPVETSATGAASLLARGPALTRPADASATPPPALALTAPANAPTMSRGARDNGAGGAPVGPGVSPPAPRLDVESSPASPLTVGVASSTASNVPPTALRSDPPLAAPAVSAPLVVAARGLDASDPAGSGLDRASALSTATAPGLAAPVTGTAPAAATPAATASGAASPERMAAPSPVSETVAAPPAVAPGRGATRPAQLLSRVPPVYPEAARRSRIAGAVDLVLSVDTQGAVVRAVAVAGSPLLRQAAEEAARKWRYRPELVDGVAVNTDRRVRIVFE